MAARLMSAASSAAVSRPTIWPTAARRRLYPFGLEGFGDGGHMVVQAALGDERACRGADQDEVERRGHQGVYDRSDQEAQRGGNQEHEEQRADAGSATPRERKCR